MPELENIAKSADILTIRPGDTLVVAFTGTGRLTDADLDKLRTSAEAYLPGVKVMIFENECSLAVYRAEDDPDAVAAT